MGAPPRCRARRVRRAQGTDVTLPSMMLSSRDGKKLQQLMAQARLGRTRARTHSRALVRLVEHARRRAAKGAEGGGQGAGDWT
eukprot:6120940-Pleurochrysis_carterae.AAC.1